MASLSLYLGLLFLSVMFYSFQCTGLACLVKCYLIILYFYAIVNSILVQFFPVAHIASL